MKMFATMLFFVLGVSMYVEASPELTIDKIKPTDMEERALIVGAYRYPAGEGRLSLMFKEEVSGEMVEIRGIEKMVSAGEGREHDVYLYAALVPAGTYRYASNSGFFKSFGPGLAGPAISWNFGMPRAGIKLAAGDIHYMGEARCFGTRTECRWMITDQATRDIGYAKLRNPALPWEMLRQMDFRHTASWYHELFKVEKYSPLQGDVGVNDFDWALPSETAGFVREGAANFGNGNITVRYTRKGSEVKSSFDIMIYPMSECAKEESCAATGLAEAVAAAFIDSSAVLGAPRHNLRYLHQMDKFEISEGDVTLTLGEGEIVGRQRQFPMLDVDSFWKKREAEPKMHWYRFLVLSHNGWFLKVRMQWETYKQAEAQEEFENFLKQMFGDRMTSQEMVVQN